MTYTSAESVVTPVAAGPLARALALAIDETVRLTLVVCAAVALASSLHPDVVWLLAIVPVVYWGYGLAFDMLGGGTLGKQALRLRVVADDGKSMTWVASSIRNLALLVDAQPFGYLVGLAAMIASKRFRRIGDVLARTQVVYADDVVEPWHATDVGLEAVRRSPVRFYAAWLAGAVPVVALTVLFWRQSPGLAGFAIWWFKPLYERLPGWLYWRTTLGERPHFTQGLAQWREAGRGLFAQLTYRRLTPRRSFDAALDIVEGLQGGARRARASALHRGDADPAIWLTIVGVHVEALLSTTAVIALCLLVLGRLALDPSALLERSIDPLFGWQANLLYVASIALVGPVYAAGGCALYLHQRDLHGRASVAQSRR